MDRYGNKLKGFYFVGFFEKNCQGKFCIDKSKPFETDENGISYGRCFSSYPYNRFPTNWEFIETDLKLKEFVKDSLFRKEMNDIWKEWCRKHKRKVFEIFHELKESETD